jgi:hypothetical protein
MPNEKSPFAKRYPPELRERAVRLAFDHRSELPPDLVLPEEAIER